MTRITGNLYEELRTFMVISAFILLRMIQTKVVEEIKTDNLCSIFFLTETRAVYEMTWKNVVEPERPKMTIWRMHFPSWIIKARIQTHT